MSELKETKKIKVFALYKYTKNILNLTQTLKIAYFLLNKAKKNYPSVYVKQGCACVRWSVCPH